VRPTLRTPQAMVVNVRGTLAPHTWGRAAPARLVVIGLGTVIAHRARSSSHRSPHSLQNTNGDMATRGASDPEPWRCQCPQRTGWG
jgi:hypothetical protein